MTTTRDVTASENMGLVHSIAQRFKGRGIEYDDLVGAGCVGLVKAIDRFDESRGLCFSTYAVPLIMGEIKGLFRQSGAVRVSRSLKDIALKASRFTEEYKKRTGREPSVYEIAQGIGADAEHTAEALCACRQPLSLTVSDDADEETQLDIPTESQEERLSENLSLYQELSTLPSNEREIIELRYFRELTQSQTARLIGTSQVQISRREKKILKKLKDKLS